MPAHSSVVSNTEADDIAGLADILQSLVRSVARQSHQIDRLIEMTDRSAQHPATAHGGSMEQVIGELERRLIEQALQAARGNRSQAARLLRITPRIINYKIRKYSIDCERFR